MKWKGKEVKCPKCGCKGILREGIHGRCLDCDHKFKLEDNHED